MSGLRTRGAAILLVLLSHACGFDDAGFGTATLAVNGRLDCSYALQATQVQLTVRAGASVVHDAMVLLEDSDSHETLQVSFDTGTGQYLALWPGYHRRVTWNITRGDDNLMARLEGPARHTLVHPRPGAMFKGQQAIDVQWAAHDGLRADEVVLTVGDANQIVLTHTLPHDSGKHTLQGSTLPHGWSTLTVSRWSRLTPAGGAPPSQLESGYSIGTNFVRQ